VELFCGPKHDEREQLPFQHFSHYQLLSSYIVDYVISRREQHKGKWKEVVLVS